MTRFQMELAGLTVGVSCRYSYTYDFCRDFRVKDRREDFQVCLPDTWEEAPDQSPQERAYLENLELFRLICGQMLRYDAFLLHSAVIAVDGEAYGFAAKSGVGKSTHMAFWQKEFGERALVVNGDKPIYRFMEDGRLYAFDTPWRGKEGLGGNCRAPVKALCFIERGAQTSVTPCSQGEVLNRIFHQLLIPKDEAGAAKLLDLVDRLLNTVEFDLIRCNLDENAARLAYEGIHGTKRSNEAL